MFMPVPQMFFTTTSPIATGALTSMPFKQRTHSVILCLGIARSVLIGSLRKWLPIKVTVDVTILVGLVHSSFAYVIPFLQAAPITFIALFESIVTVRGQPIGQLIQVISIY
jgi:hypothetical protein